MRHRARSKRMQTWGHLNRWPEILSFEKLSSPTPFQTAHRARWASLEAYNQELKISTFLSKKFSVCTPVLVPTFCSISTTLTARLAAVEFRLGLLLGRD